MSKLDKNLTNIGKRVVKYTDVYDDRDNVVVDGNEIKLESQLRKEIKQRQKPVQAWHVMKQVAQDKARKGNTKDLNDLLNIERKMRKKSHTAQRTEPFKTKRDTQVPLKFETSPLPNFYKIKSEKDNTLEKLEQDRNKRDKDFYKGLGTFFPK